MLSFDSTPIDGAEALEAFMGRPDIVVDCACKTGECPLWHPSEKRLYWTDIRGAQLFRYDPVSARVERFETGSAVGGFTIEADGALLLFMAKCAIKLWRGGGFVRTLLEEIPEERENRFNDVIADPEGRVFCGAMSTPTRAGRLYRLNTDGRLSALLDGIGTSNGLGFTLDRRGLYYTDTRAREIYRFDYDHETGDIGGRRVFVSVPEGDGGPDGLTVDAEDCVWSARWGGSCLVRYAPDGREILRIPFPAKKVSCLTFGGADYTDIYVTTAGGDNRAENGEHAGALFHLNLGIAGVPEFASRLGNLAGVFIGKDVILDRIENADRYFKVGGCGEGTRV